MIKPKSFKTRPKKFIGLLALFAVLLVALPVAAVTPSTVVSIPDANAEFCNTVTVPINITGVSDLGGVQMSLLYNSSVVEVTVVASGTLGGMAVSYTALPTANAAGNLTMVWFWTFAPPGPSGDFVFAYITLHAVGSTGQTSALDLHDTALGYATTGLDINHTVDDGVFTVGAPDLTAPTVTSKSPTGSSVAVDTVVTATFSEPMDASTINTSSFTLAGSAVSGTVSYNASTYTTTFTPGANLSYSHTYTATLTTDITDVAGNPLASNYSWSFTTEGPPACNDGSVNVAFVEGPWGPGGGTLPTIGSAFSAFSFTNVPYASVSAATLASYDTVVLITCYPMTDLTSSQRTDIINWVSNGGKLIIYDSECFSPGTVDYSWLPCRATSYGPGGWGATKLSDPWVDLSISEDNTLSSSDSGSPYYIDVDMIAEYTDAAGDMNVFIAGDPCWCADMEGTNAIDAQGQEAAPGTTGYVHAYTHHGSGLIIYNGLDIDWLDSGTDPTATTGTGYLAKIWLLELQQTWGTSTCGLPCGAAIVAPTCDFTGSPRTGMAPLKVSFTDLSTGADEWAWDFGDGGTSTAQNPTHTYTVSGTYTVTLTATGPNGSCEVTKERYIRVLPPSAVKAEPPKLTANWLLVSPEQVLPNQEVVISINIGNQGGTEGSRTVALFINGYLEQSQTVVVSPGAAQNVAFRVTKSTPGTYQVSLEGKEGQFFVIAPAEAATTNYFAGPLGTGGIIVIVVIAVVLIVAIVFLVRKRTD